MLLEAVPILTGFGGVFLCFRLEKTIGRYIWIRRAICYPHVARLNEMDDHIRGWNIMFYRLIPKAKRVHPELTWPQWFVVMFCCFLGLPIPGCVYTPRQRLVLGYPAKYKGQACKALVCRKPGKLYHRSWLHPVPVLFDNYIRTADKEVVIWRSLDGDISGRATTGRSVRYRFNWFTNLISALIH